MLQKLTVDQEKLMDIVKNENVHLLEKSTNEKDAKEGIRFLYKVAGLLEPEILIFDSPLASQLYLNKMKIPRLVMMRVEHYLEQQLRWQLSVLQRDEPHIFQQVDNIVGSQVFRLVDQQVRQIVFPQLDQRVMEEMRKIFGRQRAMDYYHASVDDMLVRGWLALCDYFERIGIVKNALLCQYKKYLMSGIFSSMYLDRLAVMSKNPLRLSRDDKGRLHNREGYAIEWADGYGQNFIHGVFLELDLFNKIFIRKDLTGRDILNLRNIEQKAVAIQYFGYDKLINELRATKIDSYIVKNAYTGIESVSELYEFDLDGRNIRFVKVQDHSTGKITVLGVPINNETSTAKAAIAWTFGLREDEYSFITET